MGSSGILKSVTLSKENVFLKILTGLLVNVQVRCEDITWKRPGLLSNPPSQQSLSDFRQHPPCNYFDPSIPPFKKEHLKSPQN
jgi:hypothetical protein